MVATPQQRLDMGKAKQIRLIGLLSIPGEPGIGVRGDGGKIPKHLSKQQVDFKGEREREKEGHQESHASHAVNLVDKFGNVKQTERVL